MKNILITGGSGFIGKNLVEQLSATYQIWAPTHHELELLDTSAVDRFFAEHPVEAVVHCAVRPGHRNAADPSRQLEYNLRMFFNLVRNVSSQQKLVLLNSGLVYGLEHYQPKMPESYFDQRLPVDEGGLSKYVAAKYIERCPNMVELRVFGVFGKYEDYAIRFISNMICKALFNLPLTIKQNRRFDYVYIDDLVPIVDYFVQNSPSRRAFNVTPDRAVTLEEIARLVLEVAGKDLPIKVAQAGMGVEYSGDNTLLRQEIKNLKFTLLRQAIERLFAWYAAHKDQINRDSLLIDK
jgi:GDP-L-fucose synthase